MLGTASSYVLRQGSADARLAGNARVHISDCPCTGKGGGDGHRLHPRM